DAGVNERYTYAPGTIAGFVQSELDGEQSQTMVTLSQDGSDALVTYANGSIHRYSLPTGTLGQATSFIDGLLRQTTYEYDDGGIGFLISKTDALLRETKYTNTIYGNLLSITYPDGSSESWERDNLDLVLK